MEAKKVEASKMDDLKNLVRNKKQSGKRTSPQENPKMVKKVVNEGKLFECPQCIIK